MRRPLIVALLLVIPVIAIGALALQPAPDEQAGPTTTTSIADERAAAPSSEPTDASAVTDPESSGDEPATSGPATTEAPPEVTVPPTDPDVPTRPRDAGPEGDRPVTTYPQPTVPEGGCPAGSGTVTITLGDGPSPGCARVERDQTVRFVNRTGGEVSLMAETLNEVVPAGASFEVRAGSAFPTGRSIFWFPGHPELSGIIEVRG